MTFAVAGTGGDRPRRTAIRPASRPSPSRRRSRRPKPSRRSLSSGPRSRSSNVRSMSRRSVKQPVYIEKLHRGAGRPPRLYRASGRSDRREAGRGPGRRDRREARRPSRLCGSCRRGSAWKCRSSASVEKRVEVPVVGIVRCRSTGSSRSGSRCRSRRSSACRSMSSAGTASRLRLRGRPPRLRGPRLSRAAAAPRAASERTEETYESEILALQRGRPGLELSRAATMAGDGYAQSLEGAAGGGYCGYSSARYGVGGGWIGGQTYGRSGYARGWSGAGGLRPAPRPAPAPVHRLA